MTEKPQIPAEDSIPMRVVACLMAVLSIISSFVFGESQVPVIEFSATQWAVIIFAVWLAIGGAAVSYHVRHNPPKNMDLMVKIAAALVLMNLVRELWQENLVAQQFQYTTPLVHALAASSVVASFELRTTGEILGYGVFGLFLMVLAATSGKSFIFAGAVLLYLILGTMLLIQACRARARVMTPSDQPLIRRLSTRKLGSSLIAAVVLLPVTSLAVFSFVPRLDSQADSIAATIRSYATSIVYGVRQTQASNTASSPQKTPSVSGERQRLLRKESNRIKAEKKERELKSKTHKLTSDSAEKQEAAKQLNQPLKAGETASGQYSKREQNKNEKAKDASLASKSNETAPKEVGGKAKRPPKSQKPAKNGNSAKDEKSNENSSPKEKEKEKEKEKAKSNPAKTNQQGNKTTDTSQKNHDSQNHVGPQNSAPGGEQKKAGSRDHSDHAHPQSSPQNNEASKPGQHKANHNKATPVKQHTSRQSPVKQSTKKKKKDLEVSDVPPLESKSDNASTKESQTPERKKSPNATANDFDDDMALDDESSNGEEVMFSLACNRSVYTKMNAMRKFDGHTWRRVESPLSLKGDPSEKGIISLSDCPFMVPSEALPVMEVAETFYLKTDLGQTVPIGGLASRMNFSQPILVDPEGTVTTHPNLKKGMMYSVLAQLPVYSLVEMRKAAEISDPEGVEPYLELPENQSLEFLKFADQVTEGGGNRFVQAERIVAYLRRNYRCEDVIPGSAGKTENMVDTFLFKTKQGDCKAYASAFICICRAVGIPARMVTGFFPGDQDPVTGATLVKRKHGHAWAEIYMEPYGWIAFDPTPGGLLPARPEENYYNAERISKEVSTYTNKLSQSADTSIQQVLAYGGKILYGLFALFALAAAVLIAKHIRPLIQNGVSAAKRHPATRLKERVYKRLSKIGVQSGPTDTGADVIKRLHEAIHAKALKAASGTDLLQVESTLAEFVKTYNAAYYGNSAVDKEKMRDLKSLCNQLCSIVK